MHNLNLSLALLVAASISAVFVFIYRSSDGAIKLPVHRDDISDTSSEPELQGEPDPFNVTSPQDWSDGYPINEDLFWANVSTPCYFFPGSSLMSV